MKVREGLLSDLAFNVLPVRFTKWWPGWMNDTTQPPRLDSRPLCIVMKRKFPCHARPELTCSTDYFFWDVEDCTSSSKGHSFICKKPYEDIGQDRYRFNYQIPCASHIRFL
jgi:hypothetical protein